MTLVTLVRRSLRFYWRTHLGVLAGTCVASAILTGALVVGNSQRYTLEQMARARLGQTEMALIADEHFFREKLASDLATELRALVAPVLRLNGSATLPDGTARANEVQVLGVDERFWKLGAGSNPLNQATADEFVLNERLARQLGGSVGDTVILRVEQPSLISRDAPLSGRSDLSVAIRGRVRAIAGDADFGRFGLEANQVPPFSVFMPLAALQAQLKHPGQANLLLTSAGTNANAALRARWTLADAGLELREVPGGAQIELRTDRVFLEPSIATAALAVSSNAVGSLTYFVNEFRHGDHTTPYSFVAAVGQGRGDDEISINSWLAEDLGAKPGDEITLRYFVIGEHRELKEESSRFRVTEIVPLEADPSWMPDFPGLSDVGNCREWEPGTPIDTGRIRPKDEEYWNRYRGTPKAFVTLRAGQRMWSNRFGNLTAVRYPAGTPVVAELRARLNPASFGLFFRPVRSQALAASRESLDFGGLFIGFSFFLIVAALLLTGMLYVFNLQQRQEEAGLLRTVGFRPRHIQFILMSEGWLLAGLGSLAGLAAGVVYTKLTLYGLSTVWHKAAGGAAFRYHAEPATLLLGAGLSFAAAVAAMWLAQHRQARQAPADLLRGENGSSSRRNAVAGNWGFWLGVTALLGTAAILVSAGRGTNPEVFFTAGTLVLLGGIGFSHALLARLTRTTGLAQSLNALGRRNAARRRGRSLATVSVLASGVFLVVGVNAFRQHPQAAAGERRSGTGGFALYARSALPVYDDLNHESGRDLFALSADAMQAVAIVPLRVREGDDASCLNLNRPTQPRLLGAPPAELARRKAFTFITPGGSWDLLKQAEPDGAVPAVGDEQTVKWALGKKLGDTLDYTDDRGQLFRIRIVGVLANSILQGSLVIAEQQFVEHFPDRGGYRAFLVDAPEARATGVAEALSRGLRDRGLEVVPTWQRLQDFLEVENTYLAIFQTLGGLGLLLGSAGLGIVVLRNVLERRGELALLQAVGFRRPALRRLVVAEHWLLVLLGLATGLAAAGLALWPSLRAPVQAAPPGGLVVMLVGLALGGLLWSWLAAWVALRGPLLTALRNE